MPRSPRTPTSSEAPAAPLQRRTSTGLATAIPRGLALLALILLPFAASPAMAAGGDATPPQASSLTATSHGHGNGHGGHGGGEEGDDETEDDGGGPPGRAGSLIKYDQRTFTVFESVGEAVVSVERFHGDDGAVTVDYWTEDGSATAGEDYTGISGSLTWADGEDDRRTLTIPILEDEDFEVRETIRLYLEVVSGDAQLHPGQGSAVLQIIDASEDNGGDDEAGPGEIRFRDGEFQAVEGDPSARIVLVRKDGSDGAVSVAWTTTDGSATAGEDYEASSGIVTWGDGEEGPRTVEVPLLEDEVEEGNETVLLVLSDPTGGAVLDGGDAAELVLLDNDGATSACVEDAETLCLAGHRFQVRVDWRTPDGGSGPGRVEAVSDISGLVDFFNPDNKEMLIKVLDACDAFDTFWVFFAATTNVDFTVSVTDTATGIVKEYMNPPGQAATPIQDTVTFDVCGE